MVEANHMQMLLGLTMLIRQTKQFTAWTEQSNGPALGHSNSAAGACVNHSQTHRRTKCLHAQIVHKGQSGERYDRLPL